MKIHCRFFFLAILFVLSAHSTPVAAQPALQELLSRITPRDTGDRNRYSLTDIQYALRARLDWNALLQRSRIVHEDSGLSFTLVVGSSLGSCGSTLVEWPVAPTMRGGQIFVSEGLLQQVFENFPDFRLEGQAEEPLEMPPVEPLEEMALEEPPSLYSEETPQSLDRIIAVFISGGAVVSDGTETPESASEILEGKVREGVSVEGVTLESRSFSPGQNQSVGEGGDAIVAFRIDSASPTPLTSFFYYDSPTAPRQARGSALVEWDKVPPRVRGASRSMAEVFSREFVRVFGNERNFGVRGGPIEILQGQRIPSIQVNFGVSPDTLGGDLDKMVEVIEGALSSLGDESE